MRTYSLGDSDHQVILCSRIFLADCAYKISVLDDTIWHLIILIHDRRKNRKCISKILFANCSFQFAIIDRCTGRLAHSGHRKDPLHLFALPAKPMLCRFTLPSFNPERAHPLSSLAILAHRYVRSRIIARIASVRVRNNSWICSPKRILKVNIFIFFPQKNQEYSKKFD